MAKRNTWTWRLGGLVAAACCVTFYCMAQTANFDRDPWLKDYASLKQALEKRYSNLAWFASPEGGVDLPALDRRTLAALQSARSDEDARSALLNFVTSFHDGHFSQLAALAPPLAVTSPRPDNPVYSRQDAAGGCAALGYALDGSTAFSTPFESMPGFHLLSDGAAQPFRAGIFTYSGKPARLGIVRIPVFENTHPALCVQAWGRDEVWNPQGKFIRGALRRAVEQLWYEALADLLRKFKTDGVAAVLVDVGDNSGGDDSGDIAARLFTAAALHSSPLWMSQDQTVSAPYFDEQLTDLREVLTSDSASKGMVEQSIATFAGQKEKLAEACPMDWVWRQRRAWTSQPCRRLTPAGSAGGPLADLNPHAVADARVARVLHWPMLVAPLWGSWTGPVYVLTNDKTYSAAEMFAAVLQNNRAAKIIGTRTGGDGCGFMNTPQPLVLPNSRLRFRIPNCVRIKADGTDEVAGVIPDIPIQAAEGENARPRAMRLLGELYADLERSRPH